MSQLKNLPWWQRGVIYQIYPRSFQDSTGNGIGDLQGIIDRLDYLNDGAEHSLGVDAIWLSPIYPSPMADSSVADYCHVHPDLCDLATFDRLVAEAGRRGIRIVLDWVPNHTSDRHHYTAGRVALSTYLDREGSESLSGLRLRPDEGIILEL